MGRSIRLVEAKVNPMNPLDKALIKSSIKSMEITGIQVQAQNGKWIDVGSILKVSVKPMPKAQFQESEQFFVSAGKGKVVGGKSVIKSAVLSFNEKGITAYPEYQFATSKGGKLISITDKSGNLRWIKNVSGKGNIFTGKETFYPTKEITAKNVADVFANTMSQPIYDTGVSRTFKTAGIHELTSVKINTKTELSLEQVFSLNEKGISSYRSLFGGKFTKKPITSYAKTFGGGVEEKPSSFVNMFKNIISGSGKTKTQTIKPAQISSLTSKNDLAFNYGNQIQNAFSVNMFKLNPIQTFSGLILPSLVSTRKVQQYKLQQIQMPKLSLGNKNQNILSTGTILLPEQKTTQEAIQSQYQIQDQEQIQDNIISPYTIGSYSFVAPKLPPYKLPKLFGFPIFPEKSGGYSEGKTYSYGKKKKRKTAYQSSVGAFALNIRMPKRKKYIMPKVFTGGELRPMINNNYTKQLNKMMTI